MRADAAIAKIDRLQQPYADGIAQFAVANRHAAIGNAQVIDHGGHTVDTAYRRGNAALVDNIGDFAFENQRAVAQAQVDGGMDGMAVEGTWAMAALA